MVTFTMFFTVKSFSVFSDCKSCLGEDGKQPLDMSSSITMCRYLHAKFSKDDRRNWPGNALLQTSQHVSFVKIQITSNTNQVSFSSRAQCTEMFALFRTEIDSVKAEL